MIPTWGTSTGRNSAGGIPSLLLDFSNQSYLLNGTAFAAFDGSPGITFSRGTNATMIDSTGKLTFAPSNQFTNSESFVNITPWPRTGLSAVIPNTIAAPDGTITADKITEDGATSAHYLGQVFSSIASVSYTCSIYVKAAERQYVQIILVGAVGSALTAGFDLSGSGATVTSAGTTSVITSVGNGWYRCSITANATISTAGASIQFRIATSLSTTPANYLGTDGSGLYLWGAQIGAVTYETAPRAYNSTTPKNLLGFTEEFDNAAWGKNNTTVNTNVIANPNGYLNADAIIETTQVSPATAFHSVAQAITKPAVNITYTATVYAKYKGRQMPISFGSGASGVAGRVDLQTGTVVASLGTYGTGWTAGSLTITLVGNGWYRVALTATTDTLTTASLQYSLHDGTTNVYTGDGVSGVYLWGAQLSDSASVDPYVYNPAAAPVSTAYYGPRFEYSTDIAYGANLIPYAYPQAFSNDAFWTKGRATAPATIATADPTGTYTAYKLTEDTSENLSHLIQWQGVSTAVIVGTQYTVSGYAKAAERTTISVSFGTDNGAFTTNGGRIDITPSSSGGTGAVSAVSGAAPIVTDAGNGWWRWSVTATATATAQFAFRVTLVSGGTTNYTGDGTSGVYIWGAQLTTSAAAVPFFYYPYTPLGLLIEEARTNLQTYSEQFDNLTGWTLSAVATPTANSTVSPAGTLTADTVIPDATSTANHFINSTVLATIGTQYTVSVYAKAAGYSYLFIRGLGLGGSNGAGFDLTNGTTSTLGAWTSSSITAVGNGWYRCVAVGTALSTAGPIFNVSSTSTYGVYSGDTVSGLYFWGAQLEAAAFVTSYIPTVSASATRSADVATMVGNNFSNWYNQTTGTLAVTFNASANSDATYVSASNGTITQNSTHIDNDTGTGNMRAVYYSGSALVAALELSAVGTVGATNRIATAYAVNDFAASRNGGAIVTDTLGAVPVGLTQLNIGTDDRLVAVNYTSNHIKTISYFNSRLPNSSLQAITA